VVTEISSTTVALSDRKC